VQEAARSQPGAQAQGCQDRAAGSMGCPGSSSRDQLGRHYCEKPQRSMWRLLAAAATLADAAATASPPLGAAPEPYAPLHGGQFSGRPAPLSPDPLVRYQFGPSVNRTALQLFTVRPTSVQVLRGGCVGCATLSSSAAPPHATITAPLTILRIDFGVELPAWLEIDSPDYNSSLHAPITMGVGEYHTPWQSGGTSHKSGTPKRYGHTWRLETNPSLYEGLRYGFLMVGSLGHGAFRPFTLGVVRAVTQAKPVNYTGSFFAPSDPLLEKVWWTAAWTVRSNLLTEYFGSILMDRGDRESWTGDAHPAQATALVAFHNLELIKQVRI
jgi:alpha-L-rhamnosidase